MSKSSKRIFGIIFIIIAIILTLLAASQFLVVFEAILKFSTIFSGNLDSFQVGEAIGNFFYWVIHFFVTFLLWKYGLRWSDRSR